MTVQSYFCFTLTSKFDLKSGYLKTITLSDIEIISPPIADNLLLMPAANS